MTELFSDPKNRIGQLLTWLNQKLLRPHPSIKDIALKKKSFLLSNFLLLLIIIFTGVDTTYLLTVPGYVPPWYGYVFLVGSYALNRVGKYQLAAALTISMFPIVVFSILVNDSSADPLSTTYYLVLSILLGSILLQKRILILLALGNSLGILLMVRYAPANFPEISSVVGPLSALLIGSALVLISMFHRDQIENERQKEISLTNERYRTLFDGILDGVYRSTHDGRFVDVNPAMIKMFGYANKDEMLAVDIKKDLYFAPEDRESLFLDTGQEKVEEFRMRRKDGSEIWVEDHGRYVHDKYGNVIFHEGILRNITSRRKFEAERENLIRELETKNAELERFTYTVSHDLKSPLITINGFLGHLQDDIASGNTNRAKRDSQRIHEAVEKMHQLLKELLELSRIGRLMNPPEPVPFESLAREALVLVHGQLELRGVTFTLGADLPIVHGDRQRLIEVLQNLIDNAVKFMGDQPNPRIEIGQHGEEDGKPVLYVKDNGIGISPEYHERVFGLFDKLDAKSDGTGIGLALVKRIVEYHGGRIWVKSEAEAGKGSTFFFTLSRSTE